MRKISANMSGLDEAGLPCLLFLFFSRRPSSNGVTAPSTVWRPYCIQSSERGDLAEGHLANKRIFRDDVMQRAQRGKRSKKRRRGEEE